MEHLQTLTARKDSIEAELEGQYGILKANNSTLNTPLVDPEGFPRADIDVYAVRHARVRIIELRNDLKAIIDQLGKALEKVYDPQNGEMVKKEMIMSDSGTSQATGSGQVPFARVNGVVPDSPASQAGLLRDDLIIQFDTLTSASFVAAGSLQPIAELVASKENQTVEIVVLRQETQRHTLQLTPRKGWGGRGLLGCHIMPHSP